MTPVVSVIVPTFNRARRLRRLLESLEAQDLDREAFEVVVVNDGSTDGTTAVLADFPKILELRQANRGPGVARNEALRVTRGQLVAFIDDDCVATRTWLRELLGAYHTAPESVGGFGGRIEPLASTLVTQFVQAERVVGHSPDRELSGSLRYLVTANAAFRRSALDAVAGFDEALSCAGEDVDLSYRIRRLGLRLVPVGDAVVLHDHERSFASVLRVYWRSGAARTRLAARHEDLSFGAGAGDALSWRAWRVRYHDYLAVTGSRARSALCVMLRVAALAAFGLSAAVQRVRSVLEPAGGTARRPRASAVHSQGETK